jgi:Protein of unknown function (DUF3060)
MALLTLSAMTACQVGVRTDAPPAPGPNPAVPSSAAANPVPSSAAANPATGASGLLTITGVGGPQNEECRGRKVVVDGTSTSVRLRGDCPSVEVRGHSNVIDVDRVDEIVMIGNANTVMWSSGLTRAEPTVQSTGTGNTAVRK